MKHENSPRLSRRQFVNGTTTALAIPSILTTRKTETIPVVGHGDYRYEIIHEWPQLPSPFQWQTTHNVAVDNSGFLYVIHEGREDLKDHPSIFVFDPQGRFVRAFGSQFQGGGHGIEVRQEGSDEFLYVCAYQHLKTFAKLDLKGNTIWQKHAPMESGVYALKENTHPEKVWGRDRFMPTNFAFLDNHDFLLTDGYGSYYIHHYDKDGNWKRCFGGPGNGEGTFQLPHGIWIDRRMNQEPTVVICDRAHHTLQYLSLEGSHIKTLTGYGLPANADIWNDLMIIPELFARLTLLDSKNQVVARLGDDTQRIRSDKEFAVRADSKLWKPGCFVHPHDACFDRNGNIFVAEWVGTGRISMLRRLS